MSRSLVFIGAPGSGKGTQSAKLVSEHGMGHVSTGDLLRAEVASGSVLGKRVKSVIDSGQLVSDDLVIELINANINLDDKAYIFDGFPRNIAQAEELNDKILNGHDYKVVYFKVDTEKLVQRLTNRRVSEDGKHIYNLISSPPKVEGVCDVTGQGLIQRKDDKEEVIRDRMKVFHETVDPMLDYYRKAGLLKELNADQEMGAVYQDITCLL